MNVQRHAEPKVVVKSQQIPVERNLARLFLLALAVGMYVAFLALSRTWIPVADNPQQPPSDHATTQPVVDKEAVIETPQTKPETTKVVTPPESEPKAAQPETQTQYSQSPTTPSSPEAEQKKPHPTPNRNIVDRGEQALPKPSQNGTPSTNPKPDNNSSLLGVVVGETGKLLRRLPL